MCKGINYCRLDGNTRIEQRADIVRKFNNDPQVSLCLISTKYDLYSYYAILKILIVGFYGYYFFFINVEINI